MIANPLRPVGVLLSACAVLLMVGCANLAEVTKSSIQWSVMNDAGDGDKAKSIHVCKPARIITPELAKSLKENPELIDPDVHCVSDTHQVTAPVVGASSKKQLMLGILPGVSTALIQADAVRSVAGKSCSGKGCPAPVVNSTVNNNLTLPSCGPDCGK